MIFRQLFEPSSSTYTYLIACEDTRVCALIDTVVETTERDMALLQKLNLTLDFTIDTHIHADHLTGATKLKALTKSKVIYPHICQLPCMDIGAKEGEPIRIGNIELHPLFTPGHTDHHFAYLIDNGTQKMVFTGDALLIEACGRTDFQSGSAEELYKSIQSKLFSLPDDTLVYPGHDYEGRLVSSIKQEKQRNPRLGNNKSQQEFVDIMNNLNLPYPKKIDYAVPGNEDCGVCPDNVPEEMRAPCEIHDQG